MVQIHDALPLHIRLTGKHENFQSIGRISFNRYGQEKQRGNKDA